MICTHSNALNPSHTHTHTHTHTPNHHQHHHHHHRKAYEAEEDRLAVVDPAVLAHHDMNTPGTSPYECCWVSHGAGPRNADYEYGHAWACTNT